MTQMVTDVMQHLLNFVSEAVKLVTDAMQRLFNFASEAVNLVELEERLREAGETYVVMEAKLIEVDRKIVIDVASLSCIHQWRELAYDIEDIVDEFRLRVGKADDATGSLKNVLQNPFAAWAISNELNQLKRRITEISQKKNQSSSTSTELDLALNKDQDLRVRGLLDQQISFDSLDYHIKPCFLYLSLFVKDSFIDVDTLYQLWISEGFLPENGGRTLVDICRTVVEELYQKNLIEVETNARGWIIKCKLNEILHDLAMVIGEERRFASIRSSMTHDKLRRLSINGRKDSIIPITMNLKSVRSFLCFDHGSDSHFANIVDALQRFKFIRVLYLSGTHLKEFPKTITTLLHLRYLGLANTGKYSIPNSIGKLKKLLTLDLEGTGISRLPEGILNCRELQVIKYGSFGGVSMEKLFHVSVPFGFGRLTQLYHLSVVECKQSLDQSREFKYLDKLIYLGIDIDDEDTLEALTDSISLMPLLETLLLRMTDYKSLPIADHELDISTLLGSISQRLEKLVLVGYFRVFPQFIEPLPMLTCIEFVGSGFDQDPLGYLGCLTHLVELTFIDAYLGETMMCDETSFIRLKKLTVKSTKLKNIVITKGGMERLEIIELMGCPILPEGMEYLTKLKKLILRDMPLDFQKRVQEDVKDLLVEFPNTTSANSVAS